VSLLADAYTSRDDADAVRYDTEPAKFGDREQFKSITILEISTLWSLMRGIEWDVNLLDQFPCVLEIHNGERLIHRLPQEMAANLACLTPDEVLAVASKWAVTEELACEPGDVQPIIDGSVRLAKKSSATGQRIYFWNCV
jgi:hypothetical protein